MASYTRQSSFSDGDTISSSLFNNEYNQLVTAFSYSSSGTTGHRHDGTAAEGGNIHTIGDQDFLNKIVVDSSNNRWGVYVQVSGAAVEQVRFQDGSIVPVTSNDIDLGTSSLQFKDLHIDGTASIDSLTLTSGATVTVILDEDDLSTNSATALATQQSIKAYVDSQFTGQSLEFSGDSGGSLSIDLDSEALTITGGTGIDTTGSTNDMSIAIDSTVATLTGSQTLTNKTLTSPDINGGTIDGATIGGSSAGDITYANLSDGTITITAFADEDDMSSNSATLVPTQQSVKAYVDAQITAEDLDFQADSGGALSIDLDSETMTFTGGTGIDTSGSGNAVTFAIDSTVTTLAGTQTLTNKTLTTPVITSISNSGTVTLPSGTTTLVGTATSDVLTNKTISGSSNTLSNIGNSSLSNSSVSFGGISVALGSSDATPAFDLSDATGYTGDSSLVTTGTISSGVWQGTAVADTYVANDLTISGGTVNNTVIGGSSPAAADFTTVDTTGNATIGGNLAVTGNLTINGTTSTVNSTTVTIDDPIFTLGGDTTPSTDDNKDRGIEFKWHNGTGAKLGFFGYDDSASVFTFIPDASNTSEVFSGSAGNVAFGAISGTSLDISGNIDVDGTTNLDVVDIDGAVDMATTLAVGGVVTANAGISVDNINIDGTTIALSSGDLTLDVAGDIILDASGADVFFSASGNVGSINMASNNVTLSSLVSDKDIIFKGNDGGSTITALTLDMSAAGSATFNAGATFGSSIDVTGTVTATKLVSADGVLELDDNGTHNGVINAPATLFINIDSDANSTGEDFIVGKDRTGTSGGTELFRVQENGNVGIGCVPATPLNVAKNGDGTIVRLLSVGIGEWDFSMGNSSTLTGVGAGALELLPLNSGTGSEFAIGQAGSSTPVLHIKSGKVGIGTSSIDGTLHLDAGASTDIIIEKDNAGYGTLRFHNDGSQVAYIQLDASEDMIHYAASDVAQIFYANNAEVMRIHGGYVSIATATVAYAGTQLNIGDTSDSESGVQIQSATNGTGFVLFGDGAGAAAYRGQIVYSHVSDSMAFNTAGGEAARFDSSQNFLVGCTALPSGGAGGVGFETGQSGGRTILQVGTTVTTAEGVARFYNPNGAIGSISLSGSATAFNTSSDYRLKENVVAMSGATDRLLQLKPSRFNFIADADTTVDGFLAHEVQDIVPEAISGAKDAVDADGNPDYQGIDQSKLVPLLVATIQELEARIAALES